jgi:hypothetical protein
MALDVPVPGVTPGPTYATQISNDLLKIDAHNHALGNGAPIGLITDHGLYLDSAQSLGVLLDVTSLTMGPLGLKVASIGGFLSIGAPTVANSNGLYFDGSVLSSTPADLTNPGHATATAQTFGGAKTFAAGVYTALVSALVGAGTEIVGQLAAGDTGTDVTINTINARAAGNLFAISNANTPLLEVDYTGLLTVTGISNTSAYHQTAGGFYTDAINTQTATTLTLTSTVADSGTAKAFLLDTSTSLATAGARLLSIANGGVEYLYVDYTGKLFVPTVSSSSSTTLAFVDTISDGATSVAFSFDTAATLSTVGSKILQILTGGIEVAHFSPVGLVVNDIHSRELSTLALVSTVADGATANAFTFDTTTALSTVGAKILQILTGGTEVAHFSPVGLVVNDIHARTLSTLALVSTVADGATANAFTFDTATALSTAGSKLATWSNNAVLQSYLDFKGGLNCLFGRVAAAQDSGAPTNAGSVTFDAMTGNSVVYTAGTGVAAFTINDPTNPFKGQTVTFIVSNASGGVLVTTWGTAFKMATWVDAADGFQAAITFCYNGTNWVEISRSATTVPN